MRLAKEEILNVMKCLSARRFSAWEFNRHARVKFTWGRTCSWLPRVLPSCVRQYVK